MSKRKSLAELLFDRTELLVQQSDAAEENLGIIDDSLNELWNNNEYAIEEKVDSYGMVFLRIASEIAKLKELKEKVLAKFENAINKQTSITERLKTRLHFLANGQPLRGELFSFHPFNSVTRTIQDYDLLDDDQRYYLVQMKASIWKQLLSDSSVELTEDKDYSIKKTIGYVSLLPDGHKAIVEDIKPSIKIT